MISINTIRDRKAPFRINDWMMDSGGIHRALYTWSMEDQPSTVRRPNQSLEKRWQSRRRCHPGPHVRTFHFTQDRPHHRRSPKNHCRSLRSLARSHKRLHHARSSGLFARSYAAHLDCYGEFLTPGQWVGVGSVCKRNGNPDQIEDILLAIKTQRPDLRLHGFGIKFHALQSPTVRQLLYSSDSMAWSFAGRKSGTEHDPRIALGYM
jgi:hypothetical protein